LTPVSSSWNVAREELRVLADLGTAADTLIVEKVEAQLEGTRILELLRMLVAKTNITIADCIVILIMIYQTNLMLNPPQPAPQQPAPQVTVNVTVDPHEIAQKVARRQIEGPRQRRALRSRGQPARC
jgi:hypothetical protein